MAATEGSQSPSIPIFDGNTQTGQDSQIPGQIPNNGYNTAERSRLQLKAFLGHKAEEMYVYRSLPLGQDRRHNHYWQFVASNSRHDPGSGRIFVELQNGCWRLIDSEEAFDALLLSLDTRGARESHLHIMLQKIETSFKENIRRNSRIASSNLTEPSPSPSFNIELANNEFEKNNALERYRDLEKYMWKECLYSSNLSAMAHGKQRCTPIQGICDSCHTSYSFEKAICPRCSRLFSTFGDKLSYPESDIEECLYPNDWDISHPIRIRLIKSLLTFLEASIPSEALQSSWTENIRNRWGSKLHESFSPPDLLQVVTWFESVIKRDYLSKDFETTEELLGTSGISEKAALGSGSVPVLPWIPQTTAAVTLRLFELDGLISYNPEQKAELISIGDKSNDIMVEKSPLKFTFLKNIGKTITDTDHGKFIKQPRSGCRGPSRGGGGKFQKRVADLVPVTGSRQNLGYSFTMSQIIKQQTHGTGRRTIRRRRIAKTTEEDELEPVRNFNVEEWIYEPVTENPNFNVSEEEDGSEPDDDGEGEEGEGHHRVEYGMEYEESSGYGIANNESRWDEMEISEDEGFEDDEEMINGGYVDGNDGRNFKVDDSDSYGSGEYSD